MAGPHTSIASGDWNTGAATVWDTGVRPVAGETVTIANTHTVSLTGAEACAILTVNAGGTLALGGQTLTTTGAVGGAGTVTGGAGGGFVYSTSLSTNTITWSLSGSDGNPFTVTAGANVQFRIQVSGCTFDWVVFDAADTAQYSAVLYAADKRYEFTNCDFKQATVGGLLLVADGVDAQCTDCHLYGNAEGIRTSFGSTLLLDGCVFGETRAPAADANSSKDIYMIDPQVVYTHNCKFTASTVVSIFKRGVVYHQAYDQDEGVWRIEQRGGAIFRSIASKKTGDYGIEMVPSSACAAAYPIYIDIPIPVETGDTPQPSIYVYNATADLDLQDAADRMVFELDPGNEWNLNETIDANTLADVYLNWRQVSFNAGDAAAGGTADKGTLILRVWLKRYIATAVVYLADPDDGM